MKDTIQSSEYLLEQRVEPIFIGASFFVQTNPVYPDPETGKSQEMDTSALSAIQVYKKGYNYIFPILLCECEDNSQPIVFFAKVATARRLLCIVYRVLKEKDSFKVYWKGYNRRSFYNRISIAEPPSVSHSIPEV